MRTTITVDIKVETPVLSLSSPQFYVRQVQAAGHRSVRPRSLLWNDLALYLCIIQLLIVCELGTVFIISIIFE